MSVLGQGEEAPVDEEDTYDKNEDVEANLLRPVGVESEPIDLMIKCFKGMLPFIMWMTGLNVIGMRDFA